MFTWNDSRVDNSRIFVHCKNNYDLRVVLCDSLEVLYSLVTGIAENADVASQEEQSGGGSSILFRSFSSSIMSRVILSCVFL